MIFSSLELLIGRGAGAITKQVSKEAANDVALAVINACRQVDGDAPLTLKEAQQDGRLGYFSMPDALQGKYQSFTEAGTEKLVLAGCSGPWKDVEEGVGDYAADLYATLRRGGGQASARSE